MFGISKKCWPLTCYCCLSGSLSALGLSSSTFLLNVLSLLDAGLEYLRTPASYLREVDRMNQFLAKALVAVEIRRMNNDLSDTETVVLVDESFSVELEKSCDTKTAAWKEAAKRDACDERLTES